MASAIYGLVLSGGKSIRMGRDKGLIAYHGRPQREYLFDLLAKFCKSVYTSCHAGQDVPAHLNPLTDQYNFQGPINGVLSAFKEFPDKAWLAVAVDMPRVNDKTLELLTGNRNPDKMATCFYNPATRLPEPLLTIWEPSAIPLLLKFVADGKISPRDFLKDHPVEMIIPPDEQIFLNINSPDQLLS